MRETRTEKTPIPLLKLKKRIYKGNGLFYEEFIFNKTTLDRFQSLLDETSEFISHCTDFSKSLSKLDECILSECLNKSSTQMFSSERIYSYLRKGYHLDSITKEKCMEMKNCMDNLEEFLVLNEGKIRKVIIKNTNSVGTSNKMKQEDCLDYFELFWILTINYKFFFFWYFYAYKNILSSLESKLSNHLNEKEDDIDLKRTLSVCLSEVKRKINEIGDIFNDNYHWFDNNIAKVIRVFTGVDSVEFNKIGFQGNFSIMMMDYKQLRMFYKSLTASFGTEKYTLQLESLVNALELKTSFYVIYGLQDQSNESRIISTSRDKNKMRLSPAKIKVYANFFQKYRKAFYNMCQIPLATSDMTKIVMINLPVYKKMMRTKNNPLNENIDSFASSQNSTYYKLTTTYRDKLDSSNNKNTDKTIPVIDYDVIYLIMKNIKRQMTKKFDVLVNIEKMISDRLLGRLVDLDELADSYYYFKISKEKNGILNNIKKNLQQQTALSLSEQSRKRKGEEKDIAFSGSKKTKTGNKLKLDNQRNHQEEEDDQEEEEIRTEDIRFVYKKYPTSRDFIDVLVNRSTREKYFFERVVFKMNQNDILEDFPDYHQKKLLKELTIVESFFAKINKFIMTTTENISKETVCVNQTKTALDFLFFDISKCKNVHKMLDSLSHVEYPVIMKRMARYDVYFFQISLKKKERCLIIKNTREKVLYKCGDLLTALSTWVFFLVKYYDPNLPEKQKNNIEIHVASLGKLFVNLEQHNNNKK